jgi:hypothetical protein
MYVRFSWGGWTVKQCQQLARDGVEGVMLPYGTTTATYLVRLRWGKCMIYVELKNQETMLHRYHRVYVLPYGGRTPGQIMNANYLGYPPHGDVNCGSRADPGLPPNASDRQVGEAIALILMREFGISLDRARDKAMFMWEINLSGEVDVRAMELRKKYCFRGLPPGNYGGVDP